MIDGCPKIEFVDVTGDIVSVRGPHGRGEGWGIAVGAAEAATFLAEKLRGLFGQIDKVTAELHDLKKSLRDEEAPLRWEVVQRGTEDSEVPEVIARFADPVWAREWAGEPGHSVLDREGE